MRKRMIDPDFWLDENLAHLGPHSRLLYIGLWGLCDDNYATFPNRPEWIKAQVFPYEDIDTRLLLDELSASGHILLFTDEKNVEFYFIKNFFKYQRVDRPSAPKYAQFDDTRLLLDELSATPRPEVKLSKDKLIEVKLRESNSSSLLKNNYLKLEDIKEKDMEEISEHYKVPIAFVQSEFEDMILWAGQKPNNIKLKDRNWRLTLMAWVKKDSFKIIERSKGDPTKRSTDARNL